MTEAAAHLWNPLAIPETEAALTFVSTLAMIASCTVILSPMSFMIKVSNGKAVSDDMMLLLPSMVMMFVQAVLWTAFGFVTTRSCICHINMFGAIMAATYLRILAQGVDGSHQWKVGVMVNGVMIVTLVFVVVILALLHNVEVQERILSAVAIFFNMGLFVAPLGYLAEVFEMKKKPGNFPLGLTLCGFFSSVLWAQYAIMTRDWAYLVPNVLGIACNGLSLVIYTHLFIQVFIEGPHTPLLKKRFTGYEKLARSKSLESESNSTGESDGETTDRSPNDSVSETETSDDSPKVAKSGEELEKDIESGDCGSADSSAETQ